MKHKHVTTCLGGGPVSKLCSCWHCTLDVCEMCKAYEGALTTDCPGTPVDGDTQQKVYTTTLDYTDAQGWHDSGKPMTERHPQWNTHLAQ